MKQYYVYILSSQENGTLYVGVTNNLSRRGDEHKSKDHPSFTKRYNVNKLVYYEVYDDPEDAIRREKNIKAWKRLWKLRLINEANSEWKDLSEGLLE